MGYLYILYSAKLDAYYIGSTHDPDRRFTEHQRGKTKYTALGIPWERKFVQEFSTIQRAQIAERQLKKWKRRDILERVILDGIFRSST